jgi:hypothetical protein
VEDPRYWAAEETLEGDREITYYAKREQKREDKHEALAVV